MIPWMVEDTAYNEIVQFLSMEAELLDQKRNKEWLALLTEDATYRMYTRVTREKGNEEAVLQASTSGFIRDDKKFLEVRVKREETEYAWSENPPSRTQHFVSNVRIAPSERSDEVKVKSYVLLYAHRGDDPYYDTIAYERHDVLRRADGHWKIASREIIPIQSRLTIDRISFFL